MQTMRYLTNWLSENANNQYFLFRLQDFRGLFPKLSQGALKTLLSRAVKSHYLVRLCRGLYLYRKAMPNDGLLLFHAAAHMRPLSFNYISLETALSDLGIISQIPISRITIMSSGRGNIISCGPYGTIEFVHTSRKPQNLMNELVYDSNCGLWRASAHLALEDMKLTHRGLDLIDWDVVHEFI